jgi:hypothetical protein
MSPESRVLAFFCQLDPGTILLALAIDTSPSEPYRGGGKPLEQGVQTRW